MVLGPCTTREPWLDKQINNGRPLKGPEPGPTPVTATSRNLEAAMAEERFREDLYYRLDVFPIHVPPLRERRADIMLLADHFVKQYSQAYQRKVVRISTASVIARFHPYPRSIS